jgi:hypothetical protein
LYVHTLQVTRAYMYERMHEGMHTHACTQTYVCMKALTRWCVCVYTHTHATHTHECMKARTPEYRAAVSEKED